MALGSPRRVMAAATLLTVTAFSPARPYCLLNRPIVTRCRSAGHSADNDITKPSVATMSVREMKIELQRRGVEHRDCVVKISTSGLKCCEPKQAEMECFELFVNSRGNGSADIIVLLLVI